MAVCHRERHGEYLRLLSTVAVERATHDELEDDDGNLGSREVGGGWSKAEVPWYRPISMRR